MISNARSLLSIFPVLILDEPFAALDETKEKLLMDELARKKTERIILVTSHRDNTQNTCDRQIIL